jgi:hypothetical protein
MSNSGGRRSFNIEEVERLVDDAVDEWEITSRIVISRDILPWGGPNEREIPGAEVSEEARRALTEPVLTHWDHIKQELAEGQIDGGDLRHGVRMVLMEAAQLALEQKVGKLLEELSLAELDEATTREVLKIDEATARRVIKTRCPYLFWC